MSRRLAEKCALLGSMHQYFFGHTLAASLGGRGGNGGTSSLMSLSIISMGRRDLQTRIRKMRVYSSISAIG